jgi:hypothetical protein
MAPPQYLALQKLRVLSLIAPELLTGERIETRGEKTVLARTRP